MVDKKIRTFSEKVKKRYPGAKVYLFGSRARDDWLKDSDYDIIVISDKFKDKKVLERSKKFYPLWNNPEDLELIAYTSKEFSRMKTKSTILKDAQKYWKEINWLVLIPNFKLFNK